MPDPDSPPVSSQNSIAKELFLRCLEADDEGAREQLLEAADPNTGSEVRRLLGVRNKGRLIDQVFNMTGADQGVVMNVTTDRNDGDSTARTKSFVSEGPGSNIDDYRLLEQIGEGGMGTVYMAQQTRPVKRKVAVKIVKPGMDSRQVVARFEAERQALALMNHSNIARIFDGGTTDSGRPYFVMELVKGIPLTDFCQSKKLSVSDRLALFVDLCRGVQHAHQRGIIHRDLKPSNVLVTLHDGQPVVKIIDFGIAKAMNSELTDKTIFTQFAAMVGTPLYMSPEQAELSGLDIDTRCDIYSLGVMLYELLTDFTPFDRETLKEKGLDEVRRMIRETQPPRPSQRISTVKGSQLETIDVEKLRELKKARSILAGELDWITMKALEKDRERRYQSAADFSDDIQRYLDGEAVEACPPSIRYQASRYLRRHRLLLASATLVMMTAGLGTLASLLFASQARTAASDAVAAKQKAEIEAERANQFAQQRDETAQQMSAEADRARKAERRERQQRLKTRRALYLADIRVTESHLQQESDTAALTTLLKHVPSSQEEDLRGWEWYYLLGRVRMSDRGWYALRWGYSIVWSTDGDRILTSGMYEGLRVNSPGRPGGILWDANEGVRQKSLYGWDRAAGDVRGARVIQRWGRSSPVGMRFGSSGAQLMDFNTGRYEWVGDENAVQHWGPFVWDTEGERFAGQFDQARVFEQNDGQWEIKKLPLNIRRLGGWSAENRYFVGVDTGKFEVPSTLKVCDGKSFEPVKEIPIEYGAWGHPFGKCHPSNQWIAIPTADRRLVVLDLESESKVIELKSSQRLGDLAWNSDGSLLAAGGDQGVVQVWRSDDWQLVDELPAHEAFVQAVAWSPDSRKLASLDEDGFCAIWTVNQPPEEQNRRLPGATDLSSFVWNDERTIQCSSRKGQLANYRISDGKRQDLLTTEGIENWQIVKSDLALSFTLNEQQENVSVILQDLTQSEAKHRFQVSVPPEDLCWSVSPDRKWLAIAGLAPAPDGNGRIATYKVVDLQTGGETPVDAPGVKFCKDCAWSPDSQRVAFVGTGTGGNRLPTVLLVDVADDMRVREQSVGDPEHWHVLQSVDWSPDGSQLIVGSSVGFNHIIDSDSLLTQLSVRTSLGSSDNVAWHPSDDRIASANNAGQVTIWDTESGTTLLAFEAGAEISQLHWSPKGEHLAALHRSGELLIWDASSGFRRSESETLDQYRRGRFRKEAHDFEKIAWRLADQGYLDEAIEKLHPYVMEPESAGGSSAWTADTTAFSYHYLVGQSAEEDGRLEDAIAAYRRAAQFPTTSFLAISRLSDFRVEGMDVGPLQPLIEIAYSTWLQDNSPWIQSLLIAAEPDHKKVRENSAIIAKKFDAFATMYKVGGADIEKVIALRENAVQFDPGNAAYRERLADDSRVSADN